MRGALTLTLAVSLLMCGCSRNEVLRVTSPSGGVDAFLLETNGGAPTSFGYEVRVATRGSHHSEEVASLSGAVRNDTAWGVNLKWSGEDKLSVEYLRAEDAKLLKETIGMEGHVIKISLHAGVYDPLAPAGGMLYNLERARTGTK